MSRARISICAAVAAALTLTMATAVAHAAFPGDNGRIVFLDTDGRGLAVTDASGAGPQEIVPAEQTGGQSDVDYSPDGSKITFTADPGGPDRTNDVYLANSDGSGVTLVRDAAGETFYAAFSADGQKIFYTESANPVDGSIWSVNLDGSGAQLVYDPSSAPANVQASPDGSKLVFDLNCAIWEVGVDGSNPTMLTSGENCDSHPDYSPDGSTIVFSSSASDQFLSTVPSGGGATTPLTAADDIWEQAPAYSPDGTKVVYLELDINAAPGEGRSLATIDAAGGSRTALIDGSTGVPNWGSDTTPVTGGPGPDPDPDPGIPACNDGIDNDADGQIDWPADGGCDSESDNNESGGNPGGGSGDGEVDGDLDAKKKQKGFKKVKVKVSCMKACTAKVSGFAKVKKGKKGKKGSAAKAKKVKMKGQTKSIDAGEATVLKLKPKGKKNKKKLKKAVKKGKKVRVPVSVRIDEAEGDSVVLKRVVRLKKK